MKNIFNEGELVVFMKYGSKVFGFDVETSDDDYKGVYINSLTSYISGGSLVSANGITRSDPYINFLNIEMNEKSDVEIFSLERYIQMAYQGQTIALDMLFIPDEFIIYKTDLWNKIIENRKLFLSKDINAFSNYSKSQYYKYITKGEILKDIETVINYLKDNVCPVNFEVEITQPSRPVIKDNVRYLWDGLPINKNCNHVDPSPMGVRQYQICDKIIQETQSYSQVWGMLQGMKSRYGVRAIEAKDSNNIDWKAITHALRALFEVRQILEEGKITFPLENKDFLLYTRKGYYTLETAIKPTMENLHIQIEDLLNKTDLPDKCDETFWKQFIIKEYKTLLANYYSNEIEKLLKSYECSYSFDHDKYKNLLPDVIKEKEISILCGDIFNKLKIL